MQLAPVAFQIDSAFSMTPCFVLFGVAERRIWALLGKENW